MSNTEVLVTIIQVIREALVLARNKDSNLRKDEAALVSLYEAATKLLYESEGQ